jgi:hypothetical protein
VREFKAQWLGVTVATLIIYYDCWFIDIQVYKLPEDRFYATYFGGDEKLGLAPDNEARDLWLKFLPPGRVLPFGCKVSFFSFSSQKIASTFLSHNSYSCVIFKYI